MAVLVRRRALDSELRWWLAALAILLAFVALTLLPVGTAFSDFSHWVAYRLITGQISAWDAVWYLVALLPWWVPITGTLIGALYWWATFVIAFGWGGLAVAVGAISWTGIGALIIAVLGAAVLG